MRCPLENGYWVVPEKFLAGEYPRTKEEASSRARLMNMVNAGITRFVDLTEPHELLPYESLLRDVSGGHAQRLPYPIRDMNTPRSPLYMLQILDRIDQELSAGERVYVHCYGGIGRTGTVVGCWLARHFGADGALERLALLWKTCPKSRRAPDSPQTLAQERFVATWIEESSVADTKESGLCE